MKLKMECANSKLTNILLASLESLSASLRLTTVREFCTTFALIGRVLSLSLNSIKQIYKAHLIIM